MKKTFLFLIPVVLLFVQCKQKKNTSVTDETTSATNVSNETKKESELRIINTDINYVWPGSTDHFDILKSEIHGDSLIIQVQYGGGCKEHVFTMNTNMHWMKSMPPKLNLYLEHESNDDNCRAMLTEELVFDLTNCRYTPGKSVVLILNGDREHIIEYKY